MWVLVSLEHFPTSRKYQFLKVKFAENPRAESNLVKTGFQKIFLHLFELKKLSY